MPHAARSRRIPFWHRAQANCSTSECRTWDREGLTVHALDLQPSVAESKGNHCHCYPFQVGFRPFGWRKQRSQTRTSRRIPTSSKHMVLTVVRKWVVEVCTVTRFLVGQVQGSFNSKQPCHSRLCYGITTCSLPSTATSLNLSNLLPKCATFLHVQPQRTKV